MNAEKRKNIVLIVLTKYMRLDDVIKWVAISFIGFILGTPSFALQEIFLPFVAFFIATFFCLAFCFAINNYYDADSDRKNPRRMHSNALASGEISKAQGMILNIFFFAISLLTIFFGTSQECCTSLSFFLYGRQHTPFRHYD